MPPISRFDFSAPQAASQDRIDQGPDPHTTISGDIRHAQSRFFARLRPTPAALLAFCAGAQAQIAELPGVQEIVISTQ
jgi:hypothetical protein